MRASLPVLIAAALLSACGPKEAPVMPEAVSDNVAAPVDVGLQQPSAEDTAKLLAALPAPYNTADLMNGQRQSALCRACHTLTPSGPDLTGPNLYGVFGRKAGSKPGFGYSDAIKNANFVWEAKHLDDWLANPQTYMPGTKMTFLGIKGEKDRTDLIAFLKVQTGYVPPAAPAMAPAKP